jgi:ribosomal protein S18 acetylase RimI-like enzyme
MINVREYELLTMETGSYRDIELDILRETLNVWKDRPGAPYELIELRDGQVLAGFCLFYRSPNTEYTFDIHTFVVGRDYRSKAVGPRLVELLEERISSQVPYAVMRIETSKIKETAIGNGFFESVGFQTIGHIPGFYEIDNDYYIYVRAVSAVRLESAKREPAMEDVSMQDDETIQS